MINEKIIKNYIASDLYRDITVKLLIVTGVILTFMGIYGGDHIFYIVTALGISLIVGSSLGNISGKRLGWPMGLWIGLLGGAVLSPWITTFLKGAEASYYAAILGPIVGALVGRWTELKDKKNIERATFGRSKKDLKPLQKKE